MSAAGHCRWHVHCGRNTATGISFHPKHALSYSMGLFLDSGCRPDCYSICTDLNQPSRSRSELAKGNEALSDALGDHPRQGSTVPVSRYFGRRYSKTGAGTKVDVEGQASPAPLLEVERQQRCGRGFIEACPPCLPRSLRKNRLPLRKWITAPEILS